MRISSTCRKAWRWRRKQVKWCEKQAKALLSSKSWATICWLTKCSSRELLTSSPTTLRETQNTESKEPLLKFWDLTPTSFACKRSQTPTTCSTSPNSKPMDILVCAQFLAKSKRRASLSRKIRSSCWQPSRVTCSECFNMKKSTTTKWQVSTMPCNLLGSPTEVLWYFWSTFRRKSK